MHTEPVDDAPQVCVFAPSPLLTTTVHDGVDGPDVHVHAGGQGPWTANMLTVLGARVRLCGPFGGEPGGVLRLLLDRDDVELRAVATSARNGCHVEDRRGGDLTCVAEMEPGALDRHELDGLHNTLLAAALGSRVTVLTGPSSPRVLAAEVYSRVAGDLAALDVPVVADLSGGPLAGVLDGGVDVLKVSHEDLLADGRAASDGLDDLLVAMEALASSTRHLVLLTRGAQPALALLDGRLLEVRVPRLHAVHTRGAGDATTAGIAAGLAHGHGLEDALRLGAAAGVVNVTRHGLASGERETIERLADRVVIAPAKTGRGAAR